MSTDNTTQPYRNPIWMTVLGWLITLIPTAMLGVSIYFKIYPLAEFEDNFRRLGWGESSNTGLAVVELGCLVLYLFPRTAVLGAILLTGYLGGAVATHVRIGDAFVLPVVLGLLIWLGLIFRSGRVGAIMPWRGNPSAPGGFLAGLAKTVLAMVVIAGLLAALILAQPGPYRFARSTTIAAPASEIFPHVNDFHKWAKWTPWLDEEPNAKVTIEGPSEGKGAVYTWSGDKVGAGKMTLIESVPNERVKIRMDFVSPIPESADVEFTFKPDGEKTNVAWSIAGEHEMVGKAFASVMPMAVMISERFDTGLSRLKEVAEEKRAK